MALVRDVTERKLAQEQLQASYIKLKKTFDDAINTMAKIAEMRDPYTAGHEQRTASLAKAIAKELNLDSMKIEQLNMAARIHDIGKIHVPAEILSKPGRLTSLEFQLIQTHSKSGYDILINMEFSPEVAQIVLQHHERLDGSGYPQGLMNEEIIQGARILAVADSVEAMASHRPYRPALGIDTALNEIEKYKGTRYDARVVDACMNLFREKGFRFEEI